MKATTKQLAVIKQIAKYGAKNFNRVTEGQKSCDLHHELFNMTFFSEGYDAKKVLNIYDVFEAIEKVVSYEKYNFGEVTTEISNPDKLVNMLSYVIGEELLSHCQTLQDKWDEKLTAKELLAIKKELLMAVNQF